MSVERQIAERARLHVGDTMRFDILGRIISARVTSIRERRVAGVAQRRLHVRVPARARSTRRRRRSCRRSRDRRTPPTRGRFQHDLVEQFPNVSVIDFHEILETLRDVMSKVTLAITVVGGLVLFSGGLILIGAVAMTKFQRVYEAAVFKTLGANTRTIARMLLFEYGVLGSLAGTDRLARRRRAHVGRQPVRARDSLARRSPASTSAASCSPPFWWRSSASSRASTCSGTSRSPRSGPSSGTVRASPLRVATRVCRTWGRVADSVFRRPSAVLARYRVIH